MQPLFKREIHPFFPLQNKNYVETVLFEYNGVGEQTSPKESRWDRDTARETRVVGLWRELFVRDCALLTWFYY